MDVWPPRPFRQGSQPESLDALVAREMAKRRAQGYNLGPSFDEALAEARAKAGEARATALSLMLDRIASAERIPDFPYVESDSLADIRAARGTGPRRMSMRMGEQELLDRVHGAWLGRCAGCLLGKPTERPWWTKESIREVLLAHNAYPLDNYFRAWDDLPTGRGFYPENLPSSQNPCLLPNIKAMPRDDDIDWAISNLMLLEECGADFSTLQVGQNWLRLLPAAQVFGAARSAYRNLVAGLEPPQTALFRNPEQEYIGAQIRADVFGYVCPGMPEYAAELAFRDAALDARGSGLYGAMAVAAMVSTAFVTNDIVKIISAGLSEIPARSRYAEMIQRVLRWREEVDDWDEAQRMALGQIQGNTEENTALSLVGLLYGEGDFGKTISIAVMGGMDTDCNGATAGSIIGAVLGAGRIDDKWSGPLRDTVRSSVAGADGVRISDLARRTLAVAAGLQERIRRVGGSESREKLARIDLGPPQGADGET